MVRQVIRREFKVALSVVSVGRLLRTMGLSPQRPLYRAYQQNPEAVQRWKDEQFPAIRSQAKAEGATIYFADEAGIRSDHHAGTTWALVGRTPVVRATGAVLDQHAVRGSARRAAPRFDMLHAGHRECCGVHRLLPALPARPAGLPDRGRAPRAPRSGHHQFVAGTDGRLKLFFLPALLTRAQPR